MSNNQSWSSRDSHEVFASRKKRDRSPEVSFEAELVREEPKSEIAIRLGEYNKRLYVHLNKKATKSYYMPLNDLEFFDLLAFFQSTLATEVEKGRDKLKEFYQDDLFADDTSSRSRKKKTQIPKSENTMAYEAEILENKKKSLEAAQKKLNLKLAEASE